MAREFTASARWSTLDGKRQGFLSRCERYAALTVPSVCPPDNFDSGQDELPLSLNSIGAQCVNSLVNSMILAMFAPSRPFMRLELPREQKQAILDGLKMTESEFREEMSAAEMDCVKELDTIGARPKLYDLMSHLIITGNAARLMDGDVMRIIGVRGFVVRRNNKGEAVEIITKEKVLKDDVDPDIQHMFKDDETEEEFYRWWKRTGNKYVETQWVGDQQIRSSKYAGQYKLNDMPIQIHTWRLPDKADYAVSLVEDYIGDFEGLDQLTEAEVNGAILASEFRWLANPAGMTRPEDIKRSVNGDVVPGQKGDLELVSAGAVAGALQVVAASAERYIRRLGAGFLLPQSIQRDAERVTAEEIRVLANQLETGLGGIYSRLALDLQRPLAFWLMDRVGGEIFKGTDFEPVVVTGLDALSRNGDLENIRAFLGDVVQIVAMPDEVKMYLKLDNLMAGLAAGRGMRSSEYVNTQKEVDAVLQKRNQAAVTQEAGMMATEQAIKTQGE